MVERLTIEQESEHPEDAMGEFADAVQHPSEHIEAVAEQRMLWPIKGFFPGWDDTDAPADRPAPPKWLPQRLFLQSATSSLLFSEFIQSFLVSNNVY